MHELVKISKPTPLTHLLQQGHTSQSFPHGSTNCRPSVQIMSLWGPFLFKQPQVCWFFFKLPFLPVPFVLNVFSDDELRMSFMEDYSSLRPSVWVTWTGTVLETGIGNSGSDKRQHHENCSLVGLKPKGLFACLFACLLVCFFFTWLQNFTALPLSVKLATHHFFRLPVFSSIHPVTTSNCSH